jgi:hypothetical protein
MRNGALLFLIGYTLPQMHKIIDHANPAAAEL